MRIFINSFRLVRGGVIAILFTSTALFVANSVMHAEPRASCNAPFGDAPALQFTDSFWNKTDFCKHTIPYTEIISGGPAPDGIPPIDTPEFESVASAKDWLRNQSPVFVLEVNGDVRAYPIAILIWHEIVNDVVGNTPVAITYCPLSNSPIVYDRRVNGQTLRLGVSGNLRNSDLIMWDDLTQSWWQQLTGEGIVGSFSGSKLTTLPSQVVEFKDFAAQYPDGKVLSRDTGFTLNYGENPYVDYDKSTQPFLFTGKIDPRLPPMEHVLAGTIGKTAVTYPFSVLAQHHVINDVVDNVNIVAFWQAGMVSALDGAIIDNSQPIGTVALYSRDLDGQTLTFHEDSSGAIRDDQTDSTWNVFGQASTGKFNGKHLRRKDAGPYYWFVWAAFRPDARIYGQM